MAKGISLHVGVNIYNRDAYRKNYGRNPEFLPNCHMDALAKQEIADRFHFRSYSILNEKATAESVLELIAAAAKDLKNGDMFFVTFSGHGAKMSDHNKDEDDGYDETWCLYDRMVVDDDLFELWKRFRPGVRILVISDSCHSGTVTKNMMNFPTKKADEVMATCLLMSACQDKQSAYVTPQLNYSLYTYWMLKVLKQYKFCESYRELHNRISNHMPISSTPNLFAFGPGADQMIRSKPFQI